MLDVRRSILLVIFAAYAATQGRFAWDTVRSLLPPPMNAPTLVNALNRRLEIGPDDLALLGPGAQAGDRVVAWNGQPVTDRHSLFTAVMAAPLGEAKLTLLRGAEHVPVTYKVTPLRDTSVEFLGGLIAITLNVLVPLVCLLLAFFVVWQRPRDAQAWLLFVSLVGWSELVHSNSWMRYGWANWFHGMAQGLQALASTLWPPAWLWFCVDFPDRSFRPKWLRVVRVAMAVPGVILAVMNGLSASWMSPERMPWQGFYEVLPNGTGSFIFLGSCFFSFTALFTRYFRERQPDQRRRIRLLITGLNIGLLPLGLMVLYSFLANKTLDDIPQVLLVPGLLLFTFVPLTLAYVVLVERAFDVGVVLRQGLQYAVATRGVQAIRLGIIAALLFYAFRIGGDTTLNTPQRLTRFSVAIGAAFLLSRAFVPVLAWVDRRFFREAVDTERLLNELHNNVVRIVDRRELLETVAVRVSEALHVPCVAALVPVNGHFVAAHSIGCSAEAKLPVECRLIERVRGGVQSIAQLRVHASSEAILLEPLSTELLLPLANQERLLGLLSLGPKQSEEPYSPADLRLLTSVARHAGLALENSRLASAVAEEAAQRERIHREIEIAREVQERLLPREGPQVTGLDYAGLCRPALTIGGDYFDYLRTPTGEIGFALGDIAGKGVPAALLMASLQASLRGLTAGGVGDLRELMAKLNTLVYDATPKNRFATFVYVLYEPQTRRARLCSAGHNASVLVRHGQVEWIRPKGIALGLTRQTAYEQVEIALEPGDRLILYTDGITEARDAEGEEYGEARLAELAVGLGELSAEESLRALIADVDRFAGETPQHDDLTAMVLRT